MRTPLRLPLLFLCALAVACNGNGSITEDSLDEMSLEENLSVPPTIDSVSPNRGPSTGGTVVEIRGTNYAAGVKVFFGDAISPSVVRVSRRLLRVTTPAHGAGAVDLKVANPVQSVVRTSGFNFTAPATTQVLALGQPELSGRPGEPVTLAFNFHGVPMPEDYAVFVHFADENGQHPDQMNADHMPPSGTSAWSGAVSYQRTYTIPATATPGEYDVLVGMYQNHAPYERVSLSAGSGVSVDAERRYAVGALTVLDPNAAPTTPTTPTSPVTPPPAATTTQVLPLSNANLVAQAGQSVTLGFNWNALPMAEDYEAFVHFVDASGQHGLMNADHTPPTGTSVWSGPVSYQRALTIPATVPNGSYSIRVGLYQRHAPYDRIALAAGPGVTADGELRYTVGTLTVSGSTSSYPTAPVTPPTGPTTGPAGQNAAYSLTFSDEFNSFDTSVWNDTIWYEPAPDTVNYRVENGRLKIWPARNSAGQFFNRTIDTDGKYYQTYGYFEMEAKLPRGKGTWPAFWLFNHIGSRRPEIDIMEAYAGGTAPWGVPGADGVAVPTAFAATIWIDANQYGGHRVLETGDLSAGFHKYGLKWEPNRLTFYFDGVEFYSEAVSFSDPMYLMLDLWYGSASGQPDGTTPTGPENSYEINYVRAWQFQ